VQPIIQILVLYDLKNNYNSTFKNDQHKCGISYFSKHLLYVKWRHLLASPIKFIFCESSPIYKTGNTKTCFLLWCGVLAYWLILRLEDHHLSTVYGHLINTFKITLTHFLHPLQLLTTHNGNVLQHNKYHERYWCICLRVLLQFHAW